MKYLIIRGERIEISEEVYQSFRQSHRREKYQDENKKTHGVLQLEGLKKEIASSCNVEDEIERRAMLRCLSTALASLNEDERKFIILHYFDNISLPKLAEEMNIEYLRCWKMRRKILNKLRKLLTEIE